MIWKLEAAGKGKGIHSTLFGFSGFCGQCASSVDLVLPTLSSIVLLIAIKVKSMNNFCGLICFEISFQIIKCQIFRIFVWLGLGNHKYQTMKHQELSGIFCSVRKCQEFLRYQEILGKLIQTCSILSKLVQSCSNLSIPLL